MAYKFWSENLFERIMRLFVWTNTGDEKQGIDPRHIESILLLNGSVGITDKNKKLTAYYGDYNGVGAYYDEFPFYMVRSPLYAGNHTIGKDIVVIRNNKLANSVYHLIHHYAIALAHADVSLVTMLVNDRSHAIASVSTAKQKNVVDQYRNGLYNGKLGTIVDPAFMGVKWENIQASGGIGLQELMETRENLLNEFLNAVGVKTVWNKKGNMIADEVGGNDAMLVLNLADMLECRQKGAEQVNKMYGTSWRVDKAPELDYENVSRETLEGNRNADNKRTISDSENK